MNEITKNDWKLFQQKLPIWQENYMEKLTKKYIKLLQKDCDASERFWALDEQMNKDKRSPGVRLTYEKSDTVFNIVKMIRQKVIGLDDIAEFSDGLKESVQYMLNI